MKIKKVFISYSQDSDEQLENVAKLANRLRTNSIEAMIDQFVDSPVEGWPMWMHNQIESSDFVLCVCSAQYKQKFEGRISAGFGKGVAWEGLIANQILYERSGKNNKFIPVLIGEELTLNIPLILKPYTYFKIPKDFEKLLYYINGLSRVEMLHFKLQEQEIKSKGLPRFTDDDGTNVKTKDKVQQDIMSPMNATFLTNPVISTKYSKEIKTWNNKIYDEISIISESKWVMPLQPFIILIDSKTNEPISLVAQSRLKIIDISESSTKVVTNQWIATIEFESDFKGVPWTISRGTAYGGILKYRPRLEDKVWKQFKRFHSEFDFQIISYNFESENGIDYIKAPTSGILTEISIDPIQIGQKLEYEQVIGYVQRGEALFPIRVKSNSIFLEQVTESFEAVHVNQSIIKVRETPSEITLTMKPARSFSHEEIFELSSPIAGEVKFGSKNFSSEPGSKVKPNIVLCSITNEDIVVNLSIDYDGKLLEIVGENGKKVEIGTTLMRFSIDHLYIRSPMIGTFYRSEHPNEKPLVKIGSIVKEGDTIFFIENIKQFNEVVSEFNGIIESIEVDDLAHVEYQQKIFRLKLTYEKRNKK